MFWSSRLLNEEGGVVGGLVKVVNYGEFCSLGGFSMSEDVWEAVMLWGLVMVGHMLH